MKKTRNFRRTLLLAVLLAALFAVCLTASAENPSANAASFDVSAVLREGETQTLTFSGEGMQSVYLQFTPEETDSYTLYCTNEEGLIYVTLLDANGNELKTSYFYSPIFLAYELPAGKTFYYELSSYDALTTNAAVTRTEPYMAGRSVPLSMGAEATTASFKQFVSFVPERTDVYVLTIEDPYHQYTSPFNMYDRNMNILPSHSFYDDPYIFIFKLTAGQPHYFRPTRPGQILRIETLQTYSAAHSWAQIALDTPFTPVSGQYESDLFSPFTPSQTKLYALTGKADGSIRGAIYDSQFKPILYYPFDAASPHNSIDATVRLLAGETYYFALECSGETPSSTGTFTLTVKGDVCPWCGKTHDGFFQKIVGWFHSIFAKVFGNKY